MQIIINLFGSIVWTLCHKHDLALVLYGEEDANTAVVTISLGGFWLGASKYYGDPVSAFG
jgi:hypothetical protein